MKKHIVIPVIVLMLWCGIRPMVPDAVAGDWAAGVNLGTNVGPGVQFQGTLREFTRSAQLSARFALGYSKADAGDPYAVRHVFINDATNGTPIDDAHCYQFRFDLLWALDNADGRSVNLFLGPRYARYTAEYVYVGGNEDFEVRTNPWGVGAGVEAVFAVGTKTEFIVQAGLDHFTRSELAGHDTMYAPDGVDINPRDGYDYGSADEAVAQPRTEILVMAGFQFIL